MFSILKKNTELEAIEEKQNWGQTINYCEIVWRDSMSNIDKLLRIMTQSWFLCSYIEQLPPFNGILEIPEVDFVRWTSLLLEAYGLGYQLFKNDARFLCISGTMMNICPEFFVSDNLYLNRIKATGLELLKAAEGKSEDGALFYGAIVKKRAIHPLVSAQWFPGESKVDLYFRDLLSHP